MDIGKINSIATDGVMSLSELKEDGVFRKIPEASIGRYIKGALDKGYRAAEDMIREYGDADIHGICRDKGIRINVIDKDSTFKFLRVRAEYSHSDRRLNIYKSSIDEMESQLDYIKLNGKKLDIDIVKIHLAHELYHYLEYEEIGLTNEELPKVNLFSIGRIKRFSTVVKTREIAAHGFCRRLLSLPIHPKLIDFIYLAGKGEISQEWLENYLEELNNNYVDLEVR